MPIDFTALATLGVRQLSPYQPGKPIEELERELGIDVAIKLASNENPWGPGRRVIEVLRGGLESIRLYPDGNAYALKKALARRHDVEPQCITLGNGSNDVLDLIARAFLNPDREAVYSEHAFAVYPIVTQAVGAGAKVAPALDAGHPMAFGHDLEAMSAMINARTQAVFIANPNNPTGTWLEHDALRAFVGSIPKHILVVVDEAYFEYVKAPGYPNTIDWLKHYPNLIVTRTFSKVYALAGLRIGYGISDPVVAEMLNRVRQPFNVNSLAQQAALAALNDEGHVLRSVELNLGGMERLRTAFDERQLRYIPSVGNFICVDMGRLALPVYQGLLSHGVIVRPVANYGFPNHLRITVGTQEQIQYLLHALDRVLRL
ncbi:MAG: histidinol-phosphate transaminase [Gammaproteobacteria bacterium]|nr:histidinol-phosphate transaminase [Gammaproteobacteria bacterium]